MKQAIVLPRKYVQGRGLLAEVDHYVGLLGKSRPVRPTRRSKICTARRWPSVS